MEKANHRKSVFVILISIIVISLATATAYLMLEIIPTINNPLNIGANTEKLRLVYTDCADDNPFHCENISQDLGLGESVEKTFQIKNESNDELGYILYFKFLQNTFKNDELVYKIENIDTGEVLIDTTPVPYREVRTANIVIKNEVKISGKSTQNFKMTVTFLNKDYNQNENIDAKYSIKLSILPKGSTISESISNELIARQSSDSTELIWGHSADIKRIEFEDMSETRTTNIKYDISSARNESVMAYLVPDTQDSNKFILYIQSDGEVVANRDSSNLFRNFTNLESIENLTNLNTSNVTSMMKMFYGCSSLATIDVSNFNTSNVTSMWDMFWQCKNLTILDVSKFNTSKVTNMSYMFASCSKLTTLDVSNFSTSNVNDMRSIFSGCSNLTTIDVSNFSTSNVNDMSMMFNLCSKLMNLDVSNFDTNNVTDMSRMFYDCSSLTTLDVSNFDTSKVTNMEYMFHGCSSLTKLDVGNFDTSKVTMMNSMFAYCSSLTELDLSKFDTSNVTNMSWMFINCNSLTTLDVKNFDTSKVTNMNRMFAGCSSLTTLNLSNFITKKVTDMALMFSGCSNLNTIVVSSFDTSNVTDMNQMFYGCSSLTTLDLSNFDTSKVTNMSSMFNGCSKLTTEIIIMGTKCTSYSYMFINATTDTNAQITVKYTEDASSLVDDMIATKSNNSNVDKASNPEPKYSITISGNYDVTLSNNQAYSFTEIELNANQEGYVVTSFKMNGVLIQGNTFKMPDTNVVISDIVLVEATIVESEHNPYPNNLSDQEYLNKTFEGATSLTVVLEYQTEGVSWDYIYLYDKNNTQYGKYGGKTQTTETITIPGDTLRIVFKTDGSGNNYYGFKATIIPNYS